MKLLNQTLLSKDIRDAGWTLRAAQDGHFAQGYWVITVKLERIDGLKVEGAGLSMAEAIRAAERRIRRAS